MGTAFLYGNGGKSDLAVKIVGGTQRPEIGKQGIVWVNTDQTITSWTMQSEEPTEPTEGMVWVGIDTGTKLNALKKNGIWFMPTSAKQYTSGAWVKKTGEYYNNDQWVAFFAATIHITYPAGSMCTATYGETTLTAPDTSGTWDCVVLNAGDWTVALDSGFSEVVSVTESGGTYTVDKWYLFRDGEQYAALTGGWKDGGSGSWGYVVFEDDLIKLHMTKFDTGGAGPANAKATHNNIVSLSGFSTIKLLGKNYTGKTSAGPFIEFSIQNSGGTDVASTNLTLKGDKEIVELSIPINTLTNPVKVMLHTYYANCDISRIWVE